MKIRKSLLLTIPLICIFGCTKDDFSLEPENYRLVKVLYYNGSSDPEPSRFTDLQYSEKGNLERESFYDYPSTLWAFQVYDYDNDNLLIERRRYSGQVGNLRLGTYTKYEYENEKLIKEELYLADGTLRRTDFYEYENGNLVNTYKLSDKLGIHHQYKYSYNELNLLVLEEAFMYDQILSSLTKYSYDDNLRLTKTEIFDHNEIISQTIDRKYTGDSGLPYEETHYDSNGDLTFRRQFIYDSFDNLTEAKIITDQGVFTEFKKKFEGKLLIERITYLPTMEFIEWGVSRYEYEKIH